MLPNEVVRRASELRLHDSPTCKVANTNKPPQSRRLTHIVSRPAQLCRAKINAGSMTWVTGSTGFPGHMVLGSLGRWVTKCDPVPCLLQTFSAIGKRGDQQQALPRSLTKYGEISSTKNVYGFNVVPPKILPLLAEFKTPMNRLDRKTYGARQVYARL